MKFLFGVAIGVVGMWAYSNGKLQALMGQAPEPLTEAFGKATERASQVAEQPAGSRFCLKGAGQGVGSRDSIRIRRQRRHQCARGNGGRRTARRTVNKLLARPNSLVSDV